MTTKAKTDSSLILSEAVVAGDLGVVSQLIREGFNPNFSSGNGWTPLMLAVMHDSPSITELLLRNGADPNLVTESQENPKRSPLAVAVCNGQYKAVKLLLACHADTTSVDANGETVLDLARKQLRYPFRTKAMHTIVHVLTRHQNKVRRTKGL